VGTPISLAGARKKLAVRSRVLSSKGETIRLSVYAPAPGRLRVSGRDEGATVIDIKSEGIISLTVRVRSRRGTPIWVLVAFTPLRGGETQRLATTLRRRATGAAFRSTSAAPGSCRPLGPKWRSADPESVEIQQMAGLQVPFAKPVTFRP
jgi:hypothetical protein